MFVVAGIGFAVWYVFHCFISIEVIKAVIPTITTIANFSPIKLLGRKTTKARV